MTIDSYYPKLKRLKGKGIFYPKSNLGKQFESDFELFYYPEVIRIIARTPFHYIYAEYSLEGYLEDSREIKLYLSIFFNELSILKEIKIGKEWDIPIKEASFPLVGYYEGGAALSNDDWGIKIENGPDTIENAEYLSAVWEITFEGLYLKLVKKNASKEQFIEQAQKIRKLLSLSSGNETIFNRQIYLFENNETFEIWRMMKNNGVGIGSIIPKIYISQYLKEVLPEFNKFSEKDKKLLWLVNNYINSPELLYVDDRIARLAQAWELLSKKWGNKPNGHKLSKSVKILKKRIEKLYHEWEIEKLYHEWEKEIKDNSDNSLIDRIKGSLKRKRSTRELMENFCSSNKLNIEKIGLSFENLIDIRNSVIHEGKMRADQNVDKSALNVLATAQFGLRLLLLKKLGYSGKINSSENGEPKIVDISEFFLD